jgi:hypothetical protein
LSWVASLGSPRVFLLVSMAFLGIAHGQSDPLPSWNDGVAKTSVIGFLSRVTAWAGAAPAPGMCRYYTDPSRTQGFWDYCQ